MKRALRWLLAILLVVQVASVHYHGASAAPDEKTIALASLSAAIGQQVTLCEDDGDPSHRSDPGSRASCEHCIFCHAVAHGLAGKPVATGIFRFATHNGIARPCRTVAFARARHLGGATPRGPPAIG